MAIFAKHAQGAQCLSSLMALVGRWRAAAMHPLVYPPRRGGQHGPCAACRGDWRRGRTRAVVPGRIGAVGDNGAGSHISTEPRCAVGGARHASAHQQCLLFVSPTVYSPGGARRECARECRGFLDRGIVAVRRALCSRGTRMRKFARTTAAPQLQRRAGVGRLADHLA